METLFGMILVFAAGHCLFAPLIDKCSDALSGLLSRRGTRRTPDAC